MAQCRIVCPESLSNAQVFDHMSHGTWKKRVDFDKHCNSDGSQMKWNRAITNGLCRKPDARLLLFKPLCRVYIK